MAAAELSPRAAVMGVGLAGGGSGSPHQQRADTGVGQGSRDAGGAGESKGLWQAKAQDKVPWCWSRGAAWCLRGWPGLETESTSLPAV